MTIFKIAAELEQIRTGQAFWCKGHAAAAPMEQQSSDPDYCKECHAVIEDIKADRKRLLEENRKMKDSDTTEKASKTSQNKQGVSGNGVNGRKSTRTTKPRQKRATTRQNGRQSCRRGK